MSTRRDDMPTTTTGPLRKRLFALLAALALTAVSCGVTTEIDPVAADEPTERVTTAKAKVRFRTTDGQAFRKGCSATPARSCVFVDGTLSFFLERVGEATEVWLTARSSFDEPILIFTLDAPPASEALLPPGAS